jgi:hypothetical protein
MAGIGTLALVAIIAGSLGGGPHFHFSNNNPTNTTQPPPTTQPTSTPPTSPPTPTTPPRAFAGREVRILDRRGLSVDTSSESYPK